MTSGVLGALLLNPPTGSGAQTMRQLQIAKELLGCSSVTVANLFPVPSANMASISELGNAFEAWLPARDAILDLLDHSEKVLFAWGVSRPGGVAGRHFVEQATWVTEQAKIRGSNVWVLGGQPRHPSRWHQYVSEVHARTAAGPHSQRIQEALLPFDL